MKTYGMNTWTNNLILVAIINVSMVMIMNGQTTIFFVGTTNGEIEESLTKCKLEEQAQKMSIVKKFKAGTRPGYLAINGDLLYAVSMDKQSENENTIRAFRISNGGEDLHLINEVSSRGINPCHIAVGRNGKNVFTANYTSGSIAQYKVTGNGGITEDQYFQQFKGKSVNETRQTSPHAHYINATIDNKFVLAADLGTDKVMIYQGLKQGKLAPYQKQPYLDLPPGSGPRHLEFHPNNHWIYVLNELNSTLAAVKYRKGKFEILGVVSTLPDDFQGDSKTAAIRVHPNGNLIYASNRGSNSISVFELDKNGMVKMVQNFSDQLGWVRDFNITPSGKFIIAGNAKTNAVVLLKLAPSGWIERFISSIKLPSPSCFAFYNISR